MKEHIKIKSKRVLIGILMAAVISVGTACGGKKAEEEPLETVQEADGSAAAELGTETADDISNESADEKKEEEQENIQTVTELSEAAQHQISGFIATWAVMGEDTYEKMKGYCPSLGAVVNYICWQDETYGPVYGASDGLPFQWGTFIEDGAWDTEPYPGYTGVYQVSKEEFRRFYESGWGIEVPEDMEYREGTEDISGFYGAELGKTGLGSTWDVAQVRIAGDEVEITGYEDGIYSLSGCFRQGTAEEPWENIDEEELRYTFTATAVESGDAEIFDGLQIIDFHVDEKE